MVYVAHPYNNKASNKKSVEMIIKELTLRNPGTTCISPIHAFGFLYTVVDYETGIEYCKDLLLKCDSALFCKGWETSKGCNIEMEFCKERGIPYEVIR